MITLIYLSKYVLGEKIVKFIILKHVSIKFEKSKNTSYQSSPLNIYSDISGMSIARNFSIFITLTKVIPTLHLILLLMTFVSHIEFELMTFHYFHHDPRKKCKFNQKICWERVKKSFYNKNSSDKNTPHTKIWQFH